MLGNMLYLYIFGDNVEEAFGHLGYLLLLDRLDSFADGQTLAAKLLHQARAAGLETEVEVVEDLRIARRDSLGCFAEPGKVPGVGDEAVLRKKIMGIKMDSRTPAEPKPDAEKNLAVQLLRLVAPVDVATDFENRLRAGGLGYGDLKKALFEHYWNHFSAARARRAELAANLDHVEAVLRDGAERARAVASLVLRRTRQACGLE